MRRVATISLSTKLLLFIGKHCRYLKCISVGMQGSLVLINEEELSKHTFVKKKHFDDCQVYEICKYIPYRRKYNSTLD